MAKKYILSLDQGTSSSRAILFDKHANIVGVEQQEFKQYYPKAGWVEQDPEEIFSSQLSVAQKLLKKLKIKANEIASIGITNQRETTIVWDKKSGKPIYNAIIWQDKRTSDFCESLKPKWNDYISKTTGLVIDSYFSATKIHWILNNIKGAKEKAKQGELLFGTVDSWLVWKLSKGNLHITDYSNASRTMLFDIKNLSWDKRLLEIFDVDESMLPNVKPSSLIYGNCDSSFFGGVEIPISGIAGDQQAALFGQTCFGKGEAKNTYGTGCFMLMNTGSDIVYSKHGLLTTIAWGLNGEVNYALEGSVFIAGAAIKWLRDGLKIIKSAHETEEISNSLDSTEGIYFVPAFSGLGAPYWDMNARGAIIGITQGVTQKHIIRATLESLAYQTKDVINSMEKDSNINLHSLKVDGGASANNFLMQFQSDILNVNVIKPTVIESTALGVAYLAGLAVDFWNISDIKKYHDIEKIFLPKITEEKRTELYSGWKNAIKKVAT